MPQLRYQRDEVVAILEFSGDMYMAGGMACSNFSAASFKPGPIDYDAWADMVEAITAKSAWISVKVALAVFCPAECQRESARVPTTLLCDCDERVHM